MNNLSLHGHQNNVCPMQPQGEVFLIGAGPGDPDLLTMRAVKLLQTADVVLYDNLVSNGVMEYTHPNAERIYVGKRCNHHALLQDEINQLMIDLARSGRQVCRLKGGDPFIFGRGGEELEALSNAGIAYQVVPGITAAAGCAAYAGIPLTHRDHAQSVTFVTGHRRAGYELNLDWQGLVNGNQTVVFYMGLQTLPDICQKLCEHGMAGDMPAAIVENGTRPEQRVMEGTLATLPALAQNHNALGPSLIIIGNIVSLHQRLAWFGESVSIESLVASLKAA
jgi:uroporphyrin-III C-methyltransferase/precorrin-2 dehydrogenase/sirohydrochlorin ferrochelatase